MVSDRPFALVRAHAAALEGHVGDELRALLDHRVMREWYPWNDAVRREVERFAETHVCVEDVGEINAANEASNARAARKGRGRAREILRAASASTPTHANR